MIATAAQKYASQSKIAQGVAARSDRAYVVAVLPSVPAFESFHGR